MPKTILFYPSVWPASRTAGTSAQHTGTCMHPTAEPAWGGGGEGEEEEGRAPPLLQT